MEELTNPELIRQNAKCDRKVSLYGYVRGAHLQHNSRVHIIGNKHGLFMLLIQGSTTSEGFLITFIFTLMVEAKTSKVKEIQL